MPDIEHRSEVRRRLLERAREDRRIVGAAVTGSAARDAEDRWSDVDLYFGVADAVPLAEVLGDWSAFVYRELGAIHHFDVHAGPAVYRAFLLDGPLEVDLGFAAADEFGPLGNGEFSVVFGDPVLRRLGTFDQGHVIGLAWHHVLHARSCLERGALWQAEYWISAVRDHVVALACHRLGHPTSYAKGADRLPAVVTDRLQETLVRTLDAEELVRALAEATRVLLDELSGADPQVCGRAEAAVARHGGHHPAAMTGTLRGHCPRVDPRPERRRMSTPAPDRVAPLPLLHESIPPDRAGVEGESARHPRAPLAGDRGSVAFFTATDAPRPG